MKALLLVAGQSKRFWPLKEKPLFPICGKPLIAHQIDRLRKGGVDNIILVGSANNLGDIGTLYPNLTLIEQEDLSLGMRGALLSALPECGEESVLIVGGNDVFDSFAYTQLSKTVWDNEIDGALLAQKVDSYFPGGYLQTDGDRIVGIQEKPGEGNEPSNLVNIVAHVHKHPQKLLEALEHVDESKDDGYEQALDTLFQSAEYHAVPYSDAWQAVKYPWHLIPLLEYLLDDIPDQSIHSSVDVHSSAVITGNVVIEEGTRVMPNACIVGPCTIGKNCIIANNALVRGSSIGDNCIVGYNTEIKSSVLHSHVWTHMTYIGDSIIGRNVSTGAGTVTGNLRLDEMCIGSQVGDDTIDTGLVKFGTVIGGGCRLGIQTSIDPGCKIGSHSFVSSCTHVEKDIPDASFVKMKKGEMVVSDNRVAAPDPEDRDKFRNKL